MNTEKNELSLLALANVEALANDEKDVYCHSGGTGSNSCSIAAGIEIIGVGVSADCLVSCNSGYYACSSLRCQCILI